ncbi:hypothetical protein H6G56_12520 [Anabaena variabilis FACHB-164]|nr:hypothetical protein [Trichormus variabilis]MBD2627283.1 hypothetical protein [Trichormus variabilis FACHB-164]
MNSELHSVEVNGLFHQLNLEEMESTSGGNTLIPLWNSNYEKSLGNDLNSLTSGYLIPLGLYNNKILTIDFSNTNVYLLF